MTRTIARWIVFLLVLTTTQSAQGQDAAGNEAKPRPVEKPPGAKAADNLPDARLEALLKEWDKKASETKSLYAEFTRTTVDVVFETKEVANGSFRYLHPDRARLDFPGGDFPEHYILNGQKLWELKPRLKSWKLYILQPESLQYVHKCMDFIGTPLPFQFGRDPHKAREPYSLKILDENAGLIHLSVTPKSDADKKFIDRAELWLNKESLLLTKLYVVETNKNEITFEFTGVWPNIEVDPNDFVQEPIPKWKFTEIDLGKDFGAAPAKPAEKK